MKSKYSLFFLTAVCVTLSLLNPTNDVYKISSVISCVGYFIVKQLEENKPK